MITLSINIPVFNTKKTYRFKHTEVFEREIPPHEMVKYLCERVAVL